MGCKLGFLFYLGLRKNGIRSGRVSLVSYSSTFYISAYSCVIDIDSLLASGGLWEMVFYWEILPPSESFQNMCLGYFPGVPVVKTLCFHITGHGFHHWSRDKDPTCCPTWPKKQNKRCLFLDTLLKPLKASCWPQKRASYTSQIF